jgi:hypothetical protein
MGKGRAVALYVFVALGLVVTLLRPGPDVSASTTELRPDLRTAPLPTSPSNFRIATAGGTTTFAFSNGLQNGGQGPFEVAPAAAPASDDCNNNGDPNDDVAMNQRIFLDSGDGVFTRGVDTGQTLHPAGCMAFHQAHSHYHVDQMSNYRLISEATGAVTKTSSKVTFCLIDNVRFDPTLPGSPPSAHFNSCGLTDQGISIGWHDVYHYSLEGQSFNVTDLPAGDYCLRSRIDPNNRFLETDESNNVAEQRYYIDPSDDTATALSGPCSVPVGPAPPNDAFSAPTPVALGATDGTNIDATKEPGEASHGGDDGGASVWYQWTPDVSVGASVHTCGSSLDTLLGVYTGDQVSTLLPVGSNDDATSICPGTLQSAVTFSAAAGTTYLIAVDGYAATTGDFALTLALPQLQVTDVKRFEGDRGTRSFTFTVSLTVPATTPVTVDFATEDGGANAGEDYRHTAGALLFEEGETSQTVTVQVFGDRVRERRERFGLRISSPVGAGLLDELGLGTIRNDDPAPTGGR